MPPAKIVIPTGAQKVLPPSIIGTTPTAVVAVVITAVSLAADGGDSCVAYINGTKHTDEAIVMAQMHSTMDEMAQQAQELSVERQMDNFFVESFNN